ncbi:WD40 repeat domain-containing protein [Nannocystaceae bacterium ST9]
MRSHARLPLLLSVALGLVACKPKAGSVNPEDSGKPEHGEVGKTDPTRPEGKPIVFASRGAPHSAPITVIALSPDGKAAMTRDTAGGVRLWPALDGSREPLVVPIRDPRSMAIAADGQGGWVAALVDTAGGARLIAVDDDGKMQPLASLPPMAMIAEMAIMPGGEQILAVGSDHVIRLYDRQGKQLAELDKPKLRPTMLRIASEAEGGARAFALTAGEFDASGYFAVEILPLELGAPGSKTLALASTGRQTVHLDGPPSTDNPTIAPDGRAAVFLQRQRTGGATWKVHGIQLDEGRSISVDTEMVSPSPPRMGLLTNGRVLLDDGTGLGRIIDLAKKRTEVTGLRSSPNVNHLASTFAGSTRAIPANNWLAVHQLDSDELLYLGYDQVSVTDVGLSANAERVAWALGDRLAVEQLEGASKGEVLEVPGTRGIGYRNVDFVDAETVVALDWAGGAQLIDWRSGEIVDAIDIGNNVSLASYTWAGEGEGLLFVRTNLWMNPLVVEVGGREFLGRYLIYGNANFTGVLAPSGESLDHWGAWALDGLAKLRRYPLEDLRPGLDTVSALERGEVLAFGNPEQFAVDGRGQQWWVRTEAASRPRLSRSKLGAGQSERDVLLPTGFITMLEPSPDGRRMAVVQARDASQVVSIYDAETLQVLWARPAAAVGGVAWSQDAGEVAIAGQFAGGVVYRVDDGSPATSRCGLEFQARKTPPISGGFFQQLSLCEQ